MDRTLFLVAVGVLAPFLASFLGVLIYRVPRKEGVVMGRSHCPACGHALGFPELVPVIGWLAFGGRCRHCRAAIPARYLLLELLVAALMLIAAWRDGPGWLFARDALFIALVTVLSFIDLDTMELPHRFTLTGVVAGLAFAAAGVGPHWTRALLGTGVGYLLPLAFSTAYKLLRGQAGMGGGDFVLLGMIGAHTGVSGAILAFLVGVFTGSIVGLALLSRARKGQNLGRLAIPFGPFLAIGGLVSLFWGPDIVGGYLRLAGLA
ncbi:prepilin peptidase [bacterium]|nr:prepilin peptidase [bacterium]